MVSPSDGDRVHPTSPQLRKRGQVVVGFAKRTRGLHEEKTKSRQIKTKSSEKDGLLGRNVCIINNWFSMSPNHPVGSELGSGRDNLTRLFLCLLARS